MCDGIADERSGVLLVCLYHVGTAIFDVIPMRGCDGTMELYLRHDLSKGKYDASTPSVLSPAGGTVSAMA